MNVRNETSLVIQLPTEEASNDVAKRLALYITPPLVLGFNADLGVGKSTLIRSLLRAWGVRGAIKSPTFSLVESYELEDFTVHHFDLYRIDHEDELMTLGFREYFENEAVICIEWVSKAGEALPRIDLRFNMEIMGTGRQLTLQALTESGMDVLNALRRKECEF